MGQLDIEFDPVNRKANLANHKVSFAHAEQSLRDPFAVTVADLDVEGGDRDT